MSSSSRHKRSSTLFEWFNTVTTANSIDPVDSGLVIVNEGRSKKGGKSRSERTGSDEVESIEGGEDEDEDEREDEDDLNHPIPLPSIEDFTFNSIMKSCQPIADTVIRGLDEVIGSYREFLGEELDAVSVKQREITREMKKVDKLANDTVSLTVNRMNKYQNTSRALNGIENLANISEQAYSSLSSIVSLLQDIDNMLPVQERLSIPESAHKSHYPKLHGLLQSVAPRKRMGNGNGNDSTSSSANLTSNILPKYRTPQSPAMSNYHHPPNRVSSMASVPPERLQPADNSPQPSNSSISSSNSSISSPPPPTILYRQPRRSISLTALSNYSASSHAMLLHKNSPESLEPVVLLQSASPATTTTTNSINDHLTNSRNPTARPIRPLSKRPLSFFSKGWPSSSTFTSSATTTPKTAKELLQQVIREET